MILTAKRHVVLQLTYWMPDYPSLLQEFTWSYTDIVPELRRTHDFLNYWRKNISATINKVLISVDDREWRDYSNVISLYKLN